ncbi:GAF domain-containing protein, partial [Atlantibacter hermannii]
MPRRIGSHHVDLGATRELLPGIVSDSWLRSERLGLRRDDQAAPVLPLADLTTAREQNRWISHQAQPQLLNLLPALKNSPAIIVMSDARGLVLDTLGNPDFLHKAQRFALQPGSLWCENARGTNAIGTALATGDFCEVAGEQHYLSHNAGLYCAATPVYHPEGTIAGVLDLSTPASQPGRDAVTLIRRAVSNIEHDWACSMLNKDRWLLRFYAPHDPSHEMVMAFHDDVLIGANRRAMQEFGLSSAS